jgi:orotidine-5'-phosphate decarboxylase
MEAKDRIILASDLPNLREVLNLVKKLKSYVGYFEVGVKLATNEGLPRAVRAIKKAGGDVFCDQKIIDIPRDAAGAARAQVKYGADIITVECIGGRKMLEAVVRAVKEEAALRRTAPPLIFGVTPVLSTLGYEDFVDTGILPKLTIDNVKNIATAEEDLVNQLAKSAALLAQECGCDGVVASPPQITILRHSLSNDFLIAATGIRPRWKNVRKGDHRKPITAGEAIRRGANYVIHGETIINPPPEIGNSVEAVKKIIKEIETIKEVKRDV